MSSPAPKWIALAIILFSSVLQPSIDGAGICAHPVQIRTVSSGSVLQGYVFSEDGDYVRFDVKNYEISEKKNLRKQVFDINEQESKFRPLIGSKLLQIVSDQKDGRAFLLFGVPKSGFLHGYIILNLENLKSIGTIEQQMRNGPVALAIDPAKRKIYLSFLSPREDREGESPFVTVIYNPRDYREIARYENSDLRIQPWSCFSEDGRELYTNQSVFNTTTDIRIRQMAFSGKPFFPVACHAGKVLLLSRAEDGTTLLNIYDTPSDKVSKEIRTAFPFNADARGWTLSRDGRLAIWDETRLVPIGQGQAIEKTGRLIFFDVVTGVKAGEVKVPSSGMQDSGILDFSFDGRKLFYRSHSKLVIISLSEMLILSEILLPFRPVGVIWP